VFILLRRKRVRGVARGPAWRLMGLIFGTMFFLMFTPTKWVHHFGLFAAVGAAMAALTTVLVSPAVLRWSRTRMAFLAAVMFLLELCFATTNGWWYVSSYGVPFNAAMPQIGGISISTIFFALFVLTALYAAWLHFASPISRSSASRRITRRRRWTPTPGKTASTAACWASQTCCCART
jgi:arabinosyltransferase B